MMFVLQLYLISDFEWIKRTLGKTRTRHRYFKVLPSSYQVRTNIVPSSYLLRIRVPWRWSGGGVIRTTYEEGTNKTQCWYPLLSNFDRFFGQFRSKSVRFWTAPDFFPRLCCTGTQEIQWFSIIIYQLWESI